MEHDVGDTPTLAAGGPLPIVIVEAVEQRGKLGVLPVERGEYRVHGYLPEQMRLMLRTVAGPLEPIVVVRGRPPEQSVCVSLDRLVAPDGRGPTLRTDRLVLRRWRVDDCHPFAKLNSDATVMEHFQQPLTREESDAFIERIEAEFDECGFGLWAVEVPGRAPFIGFVGLHRVPFDAPFTPAVEVGWRLAREHWGQGYATEAARASVRYGRDEAALDEIVSFTTPGNVRSWRVMERLGMVRDPDGDFDHPNVPVGHRLRHHVLYRFPVDDRDS
jgi:RimJ/RimL family protein N-acetyltransferase